MHVRSEALYVFWISDAKVTLSPLVRTSIVLAGLINFFGT
jgi:hypothetical protein